MISVDSLSFRCYAIHKYIKRTRGWQYNVRYIARRQEAGTRRQEAEGRGQSSMGRGQFERSEDPAKCTAFVAGGQGGEHRAEGIEHRAA